MSGESGNGNKEFVVTGLIINCLLICTGVEQETCLFHLIQCPWTPYCPLC
jgi:hypothetical protein